MGGVRSLYSIGDQEWCIKRTCYYNFFVLYVPCKDCPFLLMTLPLLLEPFSLCVVGGRTVVSASGVPDDSLVHTQHSVRESRHHHSARRHLGMSGVSTVYVVLRLLH